MSTEIEPGDEFVFPNDQDIAVTYMVVREHPDDRHLVLLVPWDDCPLKGVVDLVLPGGLYIVHGMVPLPQAPPVVRCGESLWLEKGFLDEPVGRRGPRAVKAVRQRIAALARGIIPEGRGDDEDPEYVEHMERVRKSPPRFVFEDYNYPGFAYLGTAEQFYKLADHGGCPAIVSRQRINFQDRTVSYGSTRIPIQEANFT